jgi:HAD superfamily hydrolase (TIGR01509 family)
MAPPRALLLDVMGTLVHEPFVEDIPRWLGMSLEELIRVKHPTAWIDFERGLIDEHTYGATFYTDGRTLDLAALKGALVESYRYLDGIEPLLADLRAAGHAAYALSNYSPWWRLIEDKLRLSRYLEWRFVSCDTGHRKPEPEAYLGAARALGLPPEACLFVDDRGGNVRAAQALGMPAIRFTDAASLRAALQAHGVL